MVLGCPGDGPGHVHTWDRPGLRYAVGDTGEGILEARTKRWFPTQKEYILQRFLDAETCLSEKEVLRCFKLCYKWLTAQGIEKVSSLLEVESALEKQRVESPRKMMKALLKFHGCVVCRRRVGDTRDDGSQKSSPILFPFPFSPLDVFPFPLGDQVFPFP